MYPNPIVVKCNFLYILIPVLFQKLIVPYLDTAETPYPIPGYSWHSPSSTWIQPKVSFHTWIQLKLLNSYLYKADTPYPLPGYNWHSLSPTWREWTLPISYLAGAGTPYLLPGWSWHSLSPAWRERTLPISYLTGVDTPYHLPDWSWHSLSPTWLELTLPFTYLAGADTPPTPVVSRRQYHNLCWSQDKLTSLPGSRSWDNPDL